MWASPGAAVRGRSVRGALRPGVGSRALCPSSEAPARATTRLRTTRRNRRALSAAASAPSDHSRRTRTCAAILCFGTLIFHRLVPLFHVRVSHTGNPRGGFVPSMDRPSSDDAAALVARGGAPFRIGGRRWPTTPAATCPPRTGSDTGVRAATSRPPPRLHASPATAQLSGSLPSSASSEAESEGDADRAALHGALRDDERVARTDRRVACGAGAARGGGECTAYCRSSRACGIGAERAAATYAMRHNVLQCSPRALLSGRHAVGRVGRRE